MLLEGGRYACRADAVAALVDVIESHSMGDMPADAGPGWVADNYDLEAIAGRVLQDDGQGWALQVTGAPFWDVVAAMMLGWGDTPLERTRAGATS